jgi:hypothetical protein
MNARITTYARWAALVNVFSSIVGFVGYTLARSQGEPFTSLGYLAFVIWALALVPIMLWFHQRQAEEPVRSVALLIGLLAVVSGVVLQCMLLIRALTLDQGTAWNFASAGAIGLWLILAQRDARSFLPWALRRLGLTTGVLWLLAFLLLGRSGFPAGGPSGSTITALGFGADATAYFAEILWATWLGLALLRNHTRGEAWALHEAS